MNQGARHSRSGRDVNLSPIWQNQPSWYHTPWLSSQSRSFPRHFYTNPVLCPLIQWASWGFAVPILILMCLVLEFFGNPRSGPTYYIPELTSPSRFCCWAPFRDLVGYIIKDVLLSWSWAPSLSTTSRMLSFHLWLGLQHNVDVTTVDYLPLAIALGIFKIDALNSNRQFDQVFTHYKLFPLIPLVQNITRQVARTHWALDHTCQQRNCRKSIRLHYPASTAFCSHRSSSFPDILPRVF